MTKFDELQEDLRRFERYREDVQTIHRLLRAVHDYACDERKAVLIEHLGYCLSDNVDLAIEFDRLYAEQKQQLKDAAVGEAREAGHE